MVNQESDSLLDPLQLPVVLGDGAGEGGGNSPAAKEHGAPTRSPEHIVLASVSWWDRPVAGYLGSSSAWSFSTQAPEPNALRSYPSSTTWHLYHHRQVT